MTTEENIRIDLNGTSIIVKKLEYKEATLEDEVYFHDVYITFMDGEVERFDAGDVTVLKEGDYDEGTPFTS